MGLQRLIGATGSLKQERGDRTKRVYKLVTDGQNDLGAKVQQLKAGIRPDDQRVADVLRSQFAQAVARRPDDPLFAGRPQPLTVEWTSHKLPRDGELRFVTRRSDLDLAGARGDFTLLLLDALPREGLELPPLPESAAAWVPAELTDDELDVLREVAAWAQLERDVTASEPGLRGPVQQQRGLAEASVVPVVRRVYLEAARLERGGADPLQLARFAGGVANARLSNVVATAFESSWARRYPLAPRLGLSLNAQYVPTLVKDFLPHAERGLESPRGNLRALIDAVAVPLVAHEAGGVYSVNDASPYLQFLEERLRGADPRLGLPYSAALEALADAPYGLPTGLAQLVIAALLARGKALLSGRGGVQYGFENVGSVDWGKAEFLRATGLTHSPVRASALASALGLTGTHFANVQGQGEVWRRLTAALSQLLPASLDADLAALPLGAAEVLAAVGEARTALAPARALVREHAADARAGFDALLGAYPSEGAFANAVAADAGARALTELGPRLREAHKYLLGEWEALERDERAALLTRLPEVGTLDAAHTWLADFAAHRERYMSAYLARHDVARGPDLPWRDLEEVSWPVLDAAATLTRLRAHPDARELAARRAALLQGRCGRLEGRELRLSPICPHCGYAGEEEADPARWARELRGAAAAGERSLVSELMGQRELIERHLASMSVTEATRAFLAGVFAGGDAGGLTPTIARELDGLLDGDVRFVTLPLAGVRDRLAAELEGRTVSWPEFTSAVERALTALRPEGSPTKIRVRVTE